MFASFPFILNHCIVYSCLQMSLKSYTYSSQCNQTGFRLKCPCTQMIPYSPDGQQSQKLKK